MMVVGQRLAAGRLKPGAFTLEDLRALVGGVNLRAAFALVCDCGGPHGSQRQDPRHRRRHPQRAPLPLREAGRLQLHARPGDRRLARRGRLARQEAPLHLHRADREPYLEFTIKSYFDTGATVSPSGSTPTSRAVRSSCATCGAPSTYRGPGVFVAGGAGVTPFIAILRDLHHNRKLEGVTLIASNRTEADIILREEFEAIARARGRSGPSPTIPPQASCTTASTRNSSRPTSVTSPRTSTYAAPTAWSKSCAAPSRTSAPPSKTSPGRSSSAARLQLASTLPFAFSHSSGLELRNS